MDIKSVIKERGFTMEEVAQRMMSKNGKPLTKGTLSRTIHGNPTIESLQGIADVIGCKVGDFFKDELEEEKPSPPSIVCPHCGKPINIEVKQ